jgi:nucleoporin NDC1
VLWSWLPFGPVGIRTGLLFICAFAIFVLRVAQLHVGIRTTNSPFQTFRGYLFKYQTAQTAGWYIFSAWLFSEVYIFSAPSSANIQWILGGNNQGRPRLNERPIYLMSYFFMLALLQTVYHLLYDYDRINLPVKKTGHSPSSPSAQLKAVLPGLISSSIKRAFVMILTAPLIYAFTIRKFAWEWTFYFARIFWKLPRSTALPAISPFYYTFICRTFSAGLILISLWEVGNAVFSAYVTQEPLKNERPITYESRDPNGSLLTGLRGKKLQTRVSKLPHIFTCLADYVRLLPSGS